VYANNYGSTSAGRYRYGLQGDYYDIGPRGGHATLGGFISNKNQHNYNLGYSAMVGNGGTRLGLAFSRTDYELGDAFRDLDATGVADTYSFYGATPLWNTWQRSLQLVYGYDYRDMREELRRVSYNVKKHAHTVHLGLTGHERNCKSYLGYALTGYLGTLGIDHDAYNMTGRPEGRFSKGVLDALWLQGFNKKWDFLVKVERQQSATDLDNSEEIYLGGPSAVRAYPQGEGSGDTGYQATAELRYHTSLPGLVLSTYFDGGHVNQKNDNSGTTLKGWGIGVTYAKTNDWYARFDYARRIGLGNNVFTEAEDHGRMWFMLGKIF
jgi:hemolysin activation/secretion protein